ncbi:MBL fold metallo-hydrolase [Paenibacillus cremeus]|uniref:MBL fold metallo-hydrolase n=1 Tax=Paenibacillus cremeus TaxID=2163881 RepID=A0A559K475_9BACL|nr:MBL fold metallo-hydrolase [Paenibacillus cremeus]TVY06939.1 MBL fold metallo-hydrolase [Paenibacillus cremeus]
MTYFICTTCGTQHSPSVEPPARCAICEDERQYVPLTGQAWTTLELMRESGRYSNVISQDETHLYSLRTNPGFAIGQTAYLVQNDGFNVLWDCISYLDAETLAQVQALGGVQAIALSHPHFYSSQIEWANALDAPVYIHEADKEWVMRPSERVVFWTGDTLELADGLTLHRLGGHFQGGSVLHWEKGNESKGVLLTGDTIQVVADPRWVSFMYSYPNLIPLPAAKVEEIASNVKRLPFDRLYNAFHKIVLEDANEAVQRSAKRYVEALKGNWST